VSEKRLLDIDVEVASLFVFVVLDNSSNEAVVDGAASKV
jgi:hypothetical protein